MFYILPVLLTSFLFCLQYAFVTGDCYDASKHPFAKRLKDLKCGESHIPTPSNRVMGGKNAALGEFPWMAQIIYKSSRGLEANCDGSIISDKHVITAAHCCFGNLNAQLAYVRLGEYDNRTEEDCYKGTCAPKHVDVKVKHILSHEEYELRSLKDRNDICLLVLDQEIEFTDYIQPICLPMSCKMQKESYENEVMTVAGWGYIEEDTNRRPDILQKLDVRGVNCLDYWGRLGKKMICAGKAVGRDACPGDSGGPLMRYVDSDKPHRYYLTGIVSSGAACIPRETRPHPGIYTRVSSYLPWIVSHLI